MTLRFWPERIGSPEFSFELAELEKPIWQVLSGQSGIWVWNSGERSELEIKIWESPVYRSFYSHESGWDYLTGRVPKTEPWGSSTFWGLERWERTSMRNPEEWPERLGGNQESGGVLGVRREFQEGSDDQLDQIILIKHRSEGWDFSVGSSNGEVIGDLNKNGGQSPNGVSSMEDEKGGTRDNEYG